jgi:hypothetical protein
VTLVHRTVNAGLGSGVDSDLLPHDLSTSVIDAGATV